MGRATQQAIFPSNAYGVDSGGDPLDIPNLTFDQFKAFHSSYYHPSNSRVYFYGNDDPAVRLELLDSYLKDFDKIPVTSKIQFQPKDLKHRKIEVGFPIGPGSEIKHMVAVNWLLNDQTLDSKEMLALGMLDSLLLGTSSSSLRKVLTESQLGDSVTGGGLSDELLQATFGVGLKGVKPENVDKVEVLVRSTLDKLSVDGFEQEAINAALNTLEFRLREFNTGGFPRGLALMLGMMNNWIYDKPPVEGVRFEMALAALKADLDSGKPVFQDLLKKYFTTNDHSVTVEMIPDLTMEDKMVAEEAGRLAAIKETLSVADIENIIEKTRLLKEAQMAEDSPEAKASLPRLSLSDIDRKHVEIPMSLTQLEGAKVISHDLVTSGILYADIAFDFSHLSEEDLELLPLFSRMVSEAGTSTLDETQLSRKIGAETGGVSTSLFTDIPHSAGLVSAGDDALLYFMIRGKSVSDKTSVMMEIMNDMLCNTKLDNQKRAVEMLKESKVRKESSVISAGHTYGAARLAAKYSFLGYLGELTGGLTSVRAAGSILDQAEKDWPAMLARLNRMRSAIVQRGSVLVNLTGDKAVLDTAMPEIEKFLASLPAPNVPSTPTLQQSFNKGKLAPISNEGFIVPSQVNYVVKGGQLIEPKQPVSGAYSVVARHLSTGYLWDNVRVVGGAYGGFARFSEASGRFVFLSYRDPNCAKTLDIYDNTASALETESAHITSEDTLQAVIGAVSDLDGPMNSQQKGYTSFVEYLTGETAADRQMWRDQILNTNSGDFKDFALKLKALKEGGSTSVVVFGSQAALDAANLALPEGQKLALSQAIGK
jgi:Zn-dependent M16 (insulinase) family peptidase